MSLKFRRKQIIFFRISLAQPNRRQFIPSEWQKFNCACLTCLHSNQQASVGNASWVKLPHTPGAVKSFEKSSASSFCLKSPWSRLQFKAEFKPWVCYQLGQSEFYLPVFKTSLPPENLPGALHRYPAPSAVEWQ